LKGAGGLDEIRPRPSVGQKAGRPLVVRSMPQAQRERMKTTEIKDIVSYLLGLFDTLVLLVAWPSGIKGGEGVDWTKITLKDMTNPKYRRRLAEGNIGVVMGEASGGIASIKGSVNENVLWASSAGSVQ